MKTTFYGRSNIVRRVIRWLQLIIGVLVITLSISTLLGIYLHNEDSCQRPHTKDAYDGFDAKALLERVAEVLEKTESLQSKLEYAIQDMEGNISRLELKMYLKKEVVRPLYEAHIALRQIRFPRPRGIRNTSFKEEPLINSFRVAEIRKYITPKENKGGKTNGYGMERVFNTIGHACVLQKRELEEYMKYEVGDYCKDDWLIAQKLMLHGCDPLPRRRCLARAPKHYLRPYAINESLWKVPDDRNVRWNNYQCKDFNRCFEMEKEKIKWVAKSLLSVDFLISDVLAIKPGETRIGLDYSVGTGTFGARMREQNVTIVSTALNIRAPFSEMIALRGLLPLYVTVNQRIPFFDNTMDLIHTTGFLDGCWIDLVLLEFVLFDWDRILRPGGLLWVNRFYCNRNELEEYMYMFLKFRYKKHKWVVAPKSKDEVYLSALLEKPHKSI